MKVTGPHAGGPPPEAEAARGKTQAGEIQPAGAGSVESKPAGPTFAETLAAGRAAPPASARPSAADALTADLAADLKAGRLDPQGALDRVVERIIDRQLGPDATPAQRAHLRDALRETLTTDPLVAERVRQLG